MIYYYLVIPNGPPNTSKTKSSGNSVNLTPGIVSSSPNHPEITAKQKKVEKLKGQGAFIGLIIGGVALVWLVLVYVISPTIVNGISMQPTFHTGNVLLVWKFPQTWAKITDTQYIPSRGDVVVINDTDNSGEQFVKRVIGLPGDQISIVNGKVTVHNSNHRTGFDPDNATYGKALQPTQGVFNGTVGDGEIFVMGDNRTAGASIDSRSSLGNIPSNYIVGQAVLEVFPLDDIKAL